MRAKPKSPCDCITVLSRSTAVQAADLLPPRSQAFAAVLCQATGWMMSTAKTDGDEKAAQERVHRLYRRYVEEGAYVPWVGSSVRCARRPISTVPRDCCGSSLSATRVISSGSIDGSLGSAPPGWC